MLAICSKPVKRSLGLFQNPLASNDDMSRSVRNNHWRRTQEKKASCQMLCAAALATAERHSELYDSIIHDVYVYAVVAWR